MCTKSLVLIAHNETYNWGMNNLTDIEKQMGQELPEQYDSQRQDGIDLWEKRDALVLEDDVVPTYELANWIYNGWLKESVDFVKTHNWEIFYWGKNDLDLKVTNTINRVGTFESKSNGAHAYCLTRDSAITLYDNRFPINLANDIYILILTHLY